MTLFEGKCPQCAEREREIARLREALKWIAGALKIEREGSPHDQLSHINLYAVVTAALSESEAS